MLSKFLLYFAWQLFGPDPPIIVSRETTYLTAPLRADGLPDYEKFVFEKCREGVTPENNAAVLLWQAMGPVDMPAKSFALIAKEIGLNKLPKHDECLVDPSSTAFRDKLLIWLNRNAATFSESDAEILIDQAIERPWTSEQLPPFAEWVKQNEQPIELLISASKRTRFFSPSADFLNDKRDSLYFVSLDGVQASRAAARALSARAMWHLGEGRQSDAWSDIEALYRLSRLTGQGPTLVDQFVSIAIEGIANRATLTLLATPSLSPKLARQIHEHLLSLPPRNAVIACLDQCERTGALGAIANVRNGRFDDLLLNESPGRFLFQVTIDWNVAFREINRQYDEMIVAVSLPNWPDRDAAIENFEKGIHQSGKRILTPQRLATFAFRRRDRSEFMADLFVALLLPATAQAVTIEDRANTQLTLNQLAAALAIYHAEYGDYPEKLEALVPEIIAKLPADLYHHNSFAYRRTVRGYVLYSLGDNAADDAGSNWGTHFKGYSIDIPPSETLFQLLDYDLPAEFDDSDEYDSLENHIPKDADDIAIRLPLPKLVLPKKAK